jgi:hypothetical protein
MVHSWHGLEYRAAEYFHFTTCNGGPKAWYARGLRRQIIALVERIIGWPFSQRHVAIARPIFSIQLDTRIAFGNARRLSLTEYYSVTGLAGFWILKLSVLWIIGVSLF